MSDNLQERACWLLLTYESGLTTRVINEIVVSWCHQLNLTLQEFFAADPQVWKDTCHLGVSTVENLDQARAKLTGQAFLIDQLNHNHIQLLTLLDENYPRLLKSSLKQKQAPPVLFYAGDLRILERQTIAIIGSRKAGEESLAFTRAISSYLAEQGANIISGNARGVDQTAYEGAISAEGYTTVVLPHGIRKLSGVQWRALLAKVEAGKVLLLSQFHPDAQWVVSRAMERNKVVTGLAQIVIVAESDTEGGTWAGATGALHQKRPMYVRNTETSSFALPGNKALIELGAHPLPWPTKQLENDLSPLLDKSTVLHQVKDQEPLRPDQLSLFALSGE
jgi:DNA processing protein